MAFPPTLAGIFGLAALLGLTGCEKIQALLPAAAAPSASAADAHGPAPGPSSAPHDAAHAAAHDRAAEEYALPFAWENSAVEPLGRARTFLKEMYVTNEDYTQIGSKLFPGYGEKESPRATVVTCADSRVHTAAFDASPENDDFMVRNLGNRVEGALGSVAYGVEHLETPVLFVLGHTGCTAVQAVMHGTSKLEKSVQEELSHLHAPKKEPPKDEKLAWSEAVVANVHDQVLASLKHFGRRVRSGKLTIVGGVLDFRNDLGAGAGRIVLVSVNGNREPERLDAFIDAVTGRPPTTRRTTPGRPAAKESTRQLIEALSALPPGGSTAHRPKHAPRDSEAHEPPPPQHAHH